MRSLLAIMLRFQGNWFINSIIGKQMDFIDRKVSGSNAIALLARNGMEVNEE